jgi:hypothetical protein
MVHYFSFVDPAEEFGMREDRPDAIRYFLQADIVLLQDIGDEVLEADGAGIGDSLHLEVERILGWRQAPGKRARRRTQRER